MWHRQGTLATLPWQARACDHWPLLQVALKRRAALPQNLPETPESPQVSPLHPGADPFHSVTCPRPPDPSWPSGPDSEHWAWRLPNGLLGTCPQASEIGPASRLPVTHDHGPGTARHQQGVPGCSTEGSTDSEHGPSGNPDRTQPVATAHAPSWPSPGSQPCDRRPTREGAGSKGFAHLEPSVPQCPLLESLRRRPGPAQELSVERPLQARVGLGLATPEEGTG